MVNTFVDSNLKKSIALSGDSACLVRNSRKAQSENEMQRSENILLSGLRESLRKTMQARHRHNVAERREMKAYIVMLSASF